MRLTPRHGPAPRVLGDVLARSGTTHTHLAAHAAHFGRVDGDEVFLRSIDLLIDGLLADTPKDN